MNFLHSIRWRLQLWYGVLLIGVLSGFGITAYHLERGRLYQRIDEEIQQRLPVLVESQHPTAKDSQVRDLTVSAKDSALFDRPGDGAFYYVVWFRHGVRSINPSSSAPHDVPLPEVGDPPHRLRGHLRESFLFPGPGDCVLVGRSIEGDVAGLHQLAWWLGGVGVAVLLLGLAGGQWLVIRALRPIADISTTADKIATGDLTQRINTKDTDSELGLLASVLNATFARLDAAFTQQSRFTADAAHELRTPVSVILMHAQNGLASECLNEEHREAFKASQRAAQRMRRLIESLLELARLDAGQEPLRRESFDLSRIARDCMELVRPLADERQTTLRDILPDTPCHGDPERISQVVTNLLTNAIIHTKVNTLVHVVTRLENGAALLMVVDNGPGISPTDQPRLFERFYRADQSRASATGGTGLGLAICKAIAEAHGGTLTVTSTPGKGSMFTLRLPGG